MLKQYFIFSILSKVCIKPICISESGRQCICRTGRCENLCVFSQSILCLRVYLPGNCICCSVFAHKPIEQQRFLIALGNGRISQIGSQRIIMHKTSHILLQECTSHQILIRHPVAGICMKQELQCHLRQVRVKEEIGSRSKPPQSPVFRMCIDPVFIIQASQSFSSPIFIKEGMLQDTQILPGDGRWGRGG